MKFKAKVIVDMVIEAVDLDFAKSLINSNKLTKNVSGWSKDFAMYSIQTTGN